MSESPNLTAQITQIHGSHDGFSFGRARWSDGVRLGFSYDKLNGIVRVIENREGDDAYYDVTGEEAFRVPSLRSALDACCSGFSQSQPCGAVPSGYAVPEALHAEAGGGAR